MIAFKLLVGLLAASLVVSITKACGHTPSFKKLAEETGEYAQSDEDETQGRNVSPDQLASSIIEQLRAKLDHDRARHQEILAQFMSLIGWAPNEPRNPNALNRLLPNFHNIWRPPMNDEVDGDEKTGGQSATASGVTDAERVLRGAELPGLGVKFPRE